MRLGSDRYRAAEIAGWCNACFPARVARASASERERASASESERERERERERTRENDRERERERECVCVCVCVCLCVHVIEYSWIRSWAGFRGLQRDLGVVQPCFGCVHCVVLRL